MPIGWAILSGPMTSTFFTVAHEATFVAYTGFALLVAFRGARTTLVGFLFAAALCTALWAQANVAVALGFAPVWLVDLANPARDAAWLALCLALIYPRGGRTLQWRGLLVLVSVLVFVQLAMDAFQFDAGTVAGVRLDGALIRVTITVLGLVLVENIVRNSAPSEFWSLKHLIIALGCIYIFQLATRIPEFLTHNPDPDIEIAEPLIFLLGLPLFVVSAVRFPNLSIRVHSSRAFVFHSTTLIGAGIMLQGVAVAAWYVRQYGGSTGTVLAVTILFGGALAIASALVSGGVRSRIRRLINENFFSLKYDYRLEWEKIIHALSLNPEQDSAERVLRTLCDLLDSTGGALWVYRSSWSQFLPAAKVGFASEIVPLAQNDPRIERLKLGDKVFLHLDQAAGAEEIAWRTAFESGWLVVPLRYRAAIVGLAVLAKPRSPKRLSWEDESFIRVVAMQLGAFLVQEETAQSLADTRQLQEFNKRFAFVVHDIKNSIGQLSLLVTNVQKFGDNPQFREDMTATLSNSVERLQRLLTSLSTIGSANGPGNHQNEALDLIAFLSEFTKEQSKLGHSIVLHSNSQCLEMELTNTSNLRRALEHVIANAREASGTKQQIDVAVKTEADAIQIVVTDHGTGMTEKFINEELFRPMHSTKSGGYGIGAYQARELMRDLGGDITITSRIGHGTTATLTLPRPGSLASRRL